MPSIQQFVTAAFAAALIEGQNEALTLLFLCPTADHTSSVQRLKLQLPGRSARCGFPLFHVRSSEPQSANCAPEQISHLVCGEQRVDAQHEVGDLEMPGFLVDDDG